MGGDEAPAAQSNVQTKTKKKKKKANAPQELSSKIRVPRQSQVRGFEKKVRSRDPRFDDTVAGFDEHLFRSSYKFLDEYAADELKKLQAAFKKTKDPDKKQQLRRAIDRYKQRDAARKKKERKQALKREWRRTESALARKGKKAFFLKKADQRALGLVDEFLELKKTGKLQKHIAKRRKKNAQKDKRWLPNQRRDKAS